jgi:hypothetical protein
VPFHIFQQNIANKCKLEIENSMETGNWKLKITAMPEVSP